MGRRIPPSSGGRAGQLGVTARALGEYVAPGSAPAQRNGLVLGYGMAEEGRIPELTGRLRAVVGMALDALHNPPAE